MTASSRLYCAFDASSAGCVLLRIPSSLGRRCRSPHNWKERQVLTRGYKAPHAQSARFLGVVVRDRRDRAGIHWGQNRAREGRMKIQIRVESHAGYRADEYPLRFVLRERPFEVLEVEDRWYSPATTYFRVRADD